MKEHFKKAAARLMSVAARLAYPFILNTKKEEGFEPLHPDIVKGFNKTRTFGPKTILCYAPFKMMYFAFNGEVIACCHNRKHILGKYPEQNIDDIWNGNLYNSLRLYIKNNDLSFGCQVCQHALMAKNFKGTKNRLYDRYAVKPYPLIMEFELDNICNLACEICTPLFSSKIAANQSVRTPSSPYNIQFVNEIEKYFKNLKEAKFYGGEPFLIQIYYEIWERMIRENPHISMLVQTNGTILNEKIKNMLDRGRFSFNISIDSVNKENFEKIRKNAVFDETFKNVDFFIDYCKKKKTFLGITPTPSRLNIYDLPDLTNWASRKALPVYFNTLVTPIECALWNLPAEKLNQIIEYLEASKMEAASGVAKNNTDHFRGLINQLKLWMQRNNNEAIKKINYSVEELCELRENFIKDLFDALTESQKVQYNALINQAINEIDSQANGILFYAVMKKVPVSEVVSEIVKNDTRNLKMIIAKKIYEAENEFIKT